MTWVLLINIIEHLEKYPALEMIKFFAQNKIDMIIATPTKFFNQHLYESKFEEHIPFWNIKDFKKICHVKHQKIDGGTIYFLTSKNNNLRGFGNSFLQKTRRMARLMINEFD